MHFLNMKKVTNNRLIADDILSIGQQFNALGRFAFSIHHLVFCELLAANFRRNLCSFREG